MNTTYSDSCHCGIALFGEGTDPQGTELAVINVRCLQGVDIDALPVQHFDGAASGSDGRTKQRKMPLSHPALVAHTEYEVQATPGGQGRS